MLWRLPGLILSQLDLMSFRPQGGIPIGLECNNKYYLYIMTSPSGILYAGITNDLKRRMYEHKAIARNGNFWIDHDPERPGLVVAAGDSGHGFKFAPVLGGLIADVLERKPHPYTARFAWRPRGEVVTEDARYCEA